MGTFDRTSVPGQDRQEPQEMMTELQKNRGEEEEEEDKEGNWGKKAVEEWKLEQRTTFPHLQIPH